MAPTITPPDEPFRNLGKKLRAACSGTRTTKPDTVLFRHAATKLAIAAAVIAVEVLLGLAFSENNDNQQLYAAFVAGARGRLDLAILAMFLIVTAIPHVRGKAHKLTFRCGTLCNTIAFSTIVAYIAMLVHVDGGIAKSIYTATLTSLFGVTLIVPRDNAIKIILFSITLICCSILLFLELDHAPKNVMMIVFSLSAYIFVVLIPFVHGLGAPEKED